MVGVCETLAVIPLHAIGTCGVIVSIESLERTLLILRAGLCHLYLSPMFRTVSIHELRSSSYSK